LRSREELSGEPGEGSRTMKLEASADKAPDAPAAQAIAADTRLPLSRQFDSSAALQRMSKSSKKNSAPFGRVPRPVGLLRRLGRDAAARRLFLTAVFAAAAGAWIALG
jgi:hypothetical protein